MQKIRKMISVTTVFFNELLSWFVMGKRAMAAAGKKMLQDITEFINLGSVSAVVSVICGSPLFLFSAQAVQLIVLPDVL